LTGTRSTLGPNDQPSFDGVQPLIRPVQRVPENRRTVTFARHCVVAVPEENHPDSVAGCGRQGAPDVRGAMDNWIHVAGCAYSQEEEQLVLAGYCFGTREVARKKPTDHRGQHIQPYLAIDPLQAMAGFGYTTYDCVDADQGPSLRPVDLLVPAGLNGRLDVDVLAGLIAVEPQVSDALEIQAAPRGPGLLGAGPRRAGGP
jgi:hypothetical protein